jgi:hypothetical protein
MGGTKKAASNALSNLLHLCAADHRGLIEMNREVSLSMGWLVRQADDPARTPVRVWQGWVYLDDLGGVTPAPEAGRGRRGPSGYER